MMFFHKVDNESFELYKTQAKEGNVDAMNHLGSLYEDGKIRGKPNYEEAVKWVDKAIDAGFESSISLKKSIQESMAMVGV